MSTISQQHANGFSYELLPWETSLQGWKENQYQDRRQTEPPNSVDDLARIADDLVKPVLHQVKEGRHIYCTIDGAVRYQYVSQPQDSGFEGAS